MFAYPNAVMVVGSLAAAVGLAIYSKGRSRAELLAAIVIAIVVAVIVRWCLTSQP
jgi:lipopolysaccharide export LptBFGC system permease protein LptF